LRRSRRVRRLGENWGGGLERNGGKARIWCPVHGDRAEEEDEMRRRACDMGEL